MNTEPCNITRYLGAWSDRVAAIAVIGVAFGPALPEFSDRYVENFITKWQPLVQAHRQGKY